MNPKMNEIINKETVPKMAITNNGNNLSIIIASKMEIKIIASAIITEGATINLKLFPLLIKLLYWLLIESVYAVTAFFMLGS